MALVLAGGATTLGCAAAAPDGGDAPADHTTEEAFSAAQCKSIHQHFSRELAATNVDYKLCVEDAQRELMKNLTDLVTGNLIGAQPCVGAFLATVFAGKCLMTDDVGKCLLDIGEGALESGRATTQFAKCAGNLGAQGAEGAEVTKQLTEGLKESLYVALAVVAAHSIAYVATYKLCADKLASDVQAVEPIACNPAKSICFDAPGCPTIAKTHAPRTHMTGLVDRFSIAPGSAVDSAGSKVLCRSYSVQSFNGGTSCHTN